MSGRGPHIVKMCRVIPSRCRGPLVLPLAMAFALLAPVAEGQTSTESERRRIEAVTAPTTGFTAAEAFEQLPGGAATVSGDLGREAFSRPSANMSFERELDFHLGQALFDKLWVASPASTKASDGLGPLYNARSCQACHIRDGRGQVSGRPGLVLRVGRVRDDGVLPDPLFGLQIQDSAVPGLRPEARVAVSYTETEVALIGGEVAVLRKPRYRLDAAQGELHSQSALSPRLAPQMIGLGLLEAIPEAEILAYADPDDRDGDGISGRPNRVADLETGQEALGRFGWKAGAATVLDQSAAAFASDIGISSPLLPAPWGDCTALQVECRNAPHGNGDLRGTEIDGPALALTAFYSRNLAVPARRDVDDPDVLRGKRVFYSIGCPACHVPKHVTARLSDRPEQSFQLIWPYTDLLLHDMGDGLADGLPHGVATGREWRTAPLWGIGLTEQVSGEARFLHDGRARTLLEAVLWHGGEAAAQRDRVIDLTPEDRAALIRFLESL
ncbi:thiol oxidoreductase [Ruegeria pomeroyi]|nr:thiol oxidoreductase [Ruegeria pomeroyi]